MRPAAGVSIGQAAALFGLAPSTLRWWESQGVVPVPARASGRRIYSETDLRRIGLAYLCCVVGGMPLNRAAVVIAGRRNREWRHMVAEHLAVLDERMRTTRAAHAYLSHLARCPDNDIVRECPDLDRELTERTPRGRVPVDGGCLTAARTLAHRSAAPSTRRGDRDENRRGGDVIGEATAGLCVECGVAVAKSGRGRPRRYCSAACRQRGYRQRRHRRAAADASP